jgi:hypothetical protein
MKPTKKKIDAFEAKIEGVIATYGWNVIGVFGDDETGEPTFSYTVGLADKGLPELFMSGLPPEMAHGLLNDVATRLVNGEKLQTHTPVDKVLQGYDVVLVEAKPAKAAKFTTIALARNPGCKVWQVGWPDKDGNFPWEAGYEMRYQQTILIDALS